MTLKQALRKYYEKCELTLKPNPQWRLYKFQLITGAWFTVPNQIRNEGMLRKFLIKHTPINVFSTVCSFLNPLALENRNYTYAGHIYLSDDSFIFIDIDEHNVKLAENIKTFITSENRYELWKETDSGNGIHQYYWDNESIRYRDPLRKMEYQLNLRENLVAKFKAANIQFDYKCLTDLTRVSRVIGTPNDGNLNKICREIHAYKDLQRRKPMKEGMSTPDKLPHKIRKDEACRSLSLSKPLAMKFADSVIHGVKDRWVPFIKMAKYKDYKNRLEFIRKQYKLGEIYIWEEAKHVLALSLKAVSENRYRKILSCAKANNLQAFRKYGHTWFRTSHFVCEEGILPPPKYVGKIGKGFPTGQYSRPHYNLLKEMGIVINGALDLIGKDICPIKLAYDKTIINPGERS